MFSAALFMKYFSSIYKHYEDVHSFLVSTSTCGFEKHMVNPSASHDLHKTHGSTLLFCNCLLFS